MKNAQISRSMGKLPWQKLGANEDTHSFMKNAVETMHLPLVWRYKMQLQLYQPIMSWHICSPSQSEAALIPVMSYSCIRDPINLDWPVSKIYSLQILSYVLGMWKGRVAFHQAPEPIGLEHAGCFPLRLTCNLQILVRGVGFLVLQSRKCMQVATGSQTGTSNKVLHVHEEPN